MADNRKTPVFDFKAGEFTVNYDRVITATGGAAVKEIVQKAQTTPRGRYLIYANQLARLNHKYGSDVLDIATRRDISEELRLSELQRALKEAVRYDAWVKEVYNVVVTRAESGQITATYTVRTIYDTEVEIEGVIVNG